jgi:signal peptidase
MNRPWVAAARRWIFRAVFAVSLVGILLAHGLPLWFQLHGERLLIVTSGSMEPDILAGDAVVIRQLQASELRVGQVVTFQAPGSKSYTTHRIVGIHKRYLVEDPGPEDRPSFFVQTQGDNNPKPDPDFTPIGSVRGIVTSVLPDWGYFLAWAHSAEGRLLLFGPPLLLILAAEALSWRRSADGSQPAAAPRRSRGTAPAPA